MNELARWRRSLNKFSSTLYRLRVFAYRSLLTRTFRKSKIRFPELIHPSTLVSGTVIKDRVVVAENTKIRDSLIVGKIQIGDHCGINHMKISGDVKIGRRTILMGPSQILSSIHPVMIGNFCSLAWNITIQEYNHPVDRCSTSSVRKHVLGEGRNDDKVSKGAISIGNDVWIGAQTVIVSGATIGDGAVIGANCTVVGTIPPFAIAVGSPARVIRYRFSEEIIQALLEITWWNWSDETIRSHRELFDGPLTMEKLLKVRNVEV